MLCISINTHIILILYGKSKIRIVFVIMFNIFYIIIQGIFASDISGFKKELLDRTKKPKEKAQVPERNTLNNDVKDNQLLNL
jgi:membrane glycosyltransferase